MPSLVCRARRSSSARAHESASARASNIGHQRRCTPAGPSATTPSGGTEMLGRGPERNGGAPFLLGAAANLGSTRKEREHEEGARERLLTVPPGVVFHLVHGGHFVGAPDVHQVHQVVLFKVGDADGARAAFLPHLEELEHPAPGGLSTTRFASRRGVGQRGSHFRRGALPRQRSAAGTNQAKHTLAHTHARGIGARVCPEADGFALSAQTFRQLPHRPSASGLRQLGSFVTLGSGGLEHGRVVRSEGACKTGGAARK